MEQLIFNLRNPPTMSQFKDKKGLWKDMASQMRDAADIIEAQQQSLRAHVNRKGKKVAETLRKDDPDGHFWID